MFYPKMPNGYSDGYLWRGKKRTRFNNVITVIKKTHLFKSIDGYSNGDFGNTHSNTCKLVKTEYIMNKTL